MLPRRGAPLTEADIPPPFDPPERGSFDSQAAFARAMAEYPAAAAARMRERRHMQEKLREQNRPKRNRSGRDQSGRARPSRSGRARPSDASARSLTSHEARCQRRRMSDRALDVRPVHWLS